MQTLTPLGIAVQVTAQTRSLAEAAAEVCEGWSAPATAAARMLLLDLSLWGGLASEGEPRITIGGERLTLTGREVAASADAATGSARCQVTAALAHSPDRLRDALEPVLLFLLTRSGRTPIHAAAFVVGGRTLILTGPSGAGKSCLALAASAAGLPLLSDDTVFVERGPLLAFWGQARPIHVFGADARGAEGGPERLRNGKLKRAIPVGHPICVSRAPAAVCILSRGSEASLAPIGRDEAITALPPLEPGFDLLADDIAAAFALLIADGAWRLTLSADPAEAIALLRATFDTQ